MCSTVFLISLFLFLLTRRAPRSTLFPYTTLFRSNTSARFRLDALVARRAAGPYASVRVCAAQLLLGGHTTRKMQQDRKSTRLNSSHTVISYAVFCLKKKK